jgi:hypothetical protein
MDINKEGPSRTQKTKKNTHLPPFTDTMTPKSDKRILVNIHQRNIPLGFIPKTSDLSNRKQRYSSLCSKQNPCDKRK